MAVYITEEFDSPEGAYTNYDTWDPRLLKLLQDRKHIDIRSFRSDTTRIRLFMYRLARPMSALNNVEMQTFCYGPDCIKVGTALGAPYVSHVCPNTAGQEIFRDSEHWTVGTTGPDPTLAHKNTLRLSLTGNTQLITASIDEVADLTGLDEAIPWLSPFPNFLPQSWTSPTARLCWRMRQEPPRKSPLSGHPQYR
jgi:hypothetical protein